MKQVFSKLALVQVVKFQGSTDTDKHGEETMMLICIAGTIPNRNTIAGTIGIRQNFEIGKTYLVQVRERGYDKTFGVDFNWQNLGEVSDPLKKVQLEKELGPATVLTVEHPEGYEGKYQRKTNAVVSFRSERIKAGEYEPVNGRSYSHATAAEEIKGDSLINPSINPNEESNISQKKGKEQLSKEDAARTA